MNTVTHRYMMGRVGSRHGEANRLSEIKVPAFRHNVQNSTCVDATQDVKILISNENLFYFLMVTTWGPGQCINILGIIVNVLNIVTFLRQGVQNSVNMSLLLLTISDLGSLIFTFLLSICWVPDVIKLDLPFYPGEIMFFLFYCHVIFTRVSTGVTAWIAVERCLCIVVPLKVKALITTQRTVIIIVIQYIIWIATCAMWFYTTRMRWIFDSGRNKSMFRMYKIANKDQIEGFVYMVNNLLPLILLILIVACTAVLSKALLKNAKWRKLSTTQKEVSNRDTKVVKLVLIISLVFIFCYAPGSIFYVKLLTDPDVKIGGKQTNVTFAFFGLQLLLENINATANFFIYIKMSSKFHATFRQLLGLKSNVKETETEPRKSHNKYV